MKAIAVYPGQRNSMHLEEIPQPKVTDIPDGRGVLVKVLRVGVDGTDKEINAAEYGMAPEGYNFLITGHENFGQVVEVGPNVPSTIRSGTYVVASVRRPGHSIYDQIGLQDMTTDDVYSVHTNPRSKRQVRRMVRLISSLRRPGRVSWYSRRQRCSARMVCLFCPVLPVATQKSRSTRMSSTRASSLATR